MLEILLPEIGHKDIQRWIYGSGSIFTVESYCIDILKCSSITLSCTLGYGGESSNRFINMYNRVDKEDTFSHGMGYCIGIFKFDKDVVEGLIRDGYLVNIKSLNLKK